MTSSEAEALAWLVRQLQWERRLDVLRKRPAEGAAATYVHDRRRRANGHHTSHQQRQHDFAASRRRGDQRRANGRTVVLCDRRVELVVEHPSPVVDPLALDDSQLRHERRVQDVERSSFSRPVDARLEDRPATDETLPHPCQQLVVDRPLEVDHPHEMGAAPLLELVEDVLARTELPYPLDGCSGVGCRHRPPLHQARGRAQRTSMSREVSEPGTPRGEGLDFAMPSALAQGSPRAHGRDR